MYTMPQVPMDCHKTHLDLNKHEHHHTEELSPIFVPNGVQKQHSVISEARRKREEEEASENYFQVSFENEMTGNYAFLQHSKICSYCYLSIQNVSKYTLPLPRKSDLISFNPQIIQTVNTVDCQHS
jgi:hypothetical protein